MVIWPPPYSPFGISPSNVAYSSGWSSVCTARWLWSGDSGKPFGSAHEARTPSRSRRRSQCRLRAWCSWITNRFAARRFEPRRPMGSGVLSGSLLARYVSSPGEPFVTGRFAFGATRLHRSQEGVRIERVTPGYGSQGCSAEATTAHFGGDDEPAGADRSPARRGSAAL